MWHTACFPSLGTTHTALPQNSPAQWSKSWRQGGTVPSKVLIGGTAMLTPPSDCTEGSCTRLLIARLPRYSHISYYIKEHFHWLPISTRIEYKVLFIVLKKNLSFTRSNNVLNFGMTRSKSFRFL